MRGIRGAADERKRRQAPNRALPFQVLGKTARIGRADLRTLKKAQAELA
jgi:hypothetical protein